MTDIEDFIKTKNSSGKNDHNNIDTTKYDLNKCKNIFSNLLTWLSKYEGIDEKDTTNLNKLFESQLNKQIRLSKIQDLKKSVLLNIFNNLLLKLILIYLYIHILIY